MSIGALPWLYGFTFVVGIIIVLVMVVAATRNIK